MSRWPKIAAEEAEIARAVDAYQGAKGAAKTKTEDEACARLGRVQARSAWVVRQTDGETRAAHRDRMRSALTELEALEVVAAKSTNPMLFQRMSDLEDEIESWERRIRRSEYAEDADEG